MRWNSNAFMKQRDEEILSCDGRAAHPAFEAQAAALAATGGRNA
jgi:hypothetical protein